MFLISSAWLDLTNLTCSSAIKLTRSLSIQGQLNEDLSNSQLDSMVRDVQEIFPQVCKLLYKLIVMYVLFVCVLQTMIKTKTEITFTII